MNWEAIVIGTFGVATCLAIAFIAIIWGSQGDGYHGSGQRDAAETGGCIAVIALIAAVFVIGFVIEAQL